MEKCKRGGQIPAFGDWDTTNDLPITRYFECARQAGLIRNSGSAPGGATNDLYAVDFIKPTHCSAAVPRQTRGVCRRYPHVKEQRKQIKVCDVKDPPRKQPLPHSQNQKHSPKHSNKAGGGYITSQKTTATTTSNVKAVDEDLYKISPELIYTSKREALLTRFKMLTIGLYGVNLDSRGPSDQCPMKECTSYESLLGLDKGMKSFKKV